ncbi:MAG: DUF2274 domain-containing protein [Usitatibacteraceae bacterium]
MNGIALKLKPLAPPPAEIKRSFKLKQSIVDSIDAYRAIYKSTYGQDITGDALVSEILSDFFSRDKAFQKARKKTK